MKVYGIVHEDPLTGVCSPVDKYLFSSEEDAEAVLKKTFPNGSEYKVVEYLVNGNWNEIADNYEKFVDRFGDILTCTKHIRYVLWAMLTGTNNEVKLESLEDILRSTNDIIDISLDGRRFASDKERKLMSDDWDEDEEDVE